MINPDLLPTSFWTKSKGQFQTANSEVFGANLISKQKLGIKLLPNCIVWIHVYGNNLHGKDILIGWNCYCQARQLRLLPQGIRFKHMFQPYSTLKHMYSIFKAPSQFIQIVSKLKSLCADSHANFKHPNPLCKNEELFVKLPFKLNEDINPTKATHPGIPDDLKLAQHECSPLYLSMSS
jgi:hypothetical protein